MSILHSGERLQCFEMMMMKAQQEHRVFRNSFITILTLLTFSLLSLIKFLWDKLTIWSLRKKISNNKLQEDTEIFDCMEIETVASQKEKVKQTIIITLEGWQLDSIASEYQQLFLSLWNLATKYDLRKDKNIITVTELSTISWDNTEVQSRSITWPTDSIASSSNVKSTTCDFSELQDDNINLLKYSVYDKEEKSVIEYPLKEEDESQKEEDNEYEKEENDKQKKDEKQDDKEKDTQENDNESEVTEERVRRSIQIPSRFKSRFQGNGGCFLYYLQNHYSVTIVMNKRKMHIKGTLENVIKCYNTVKELVTEWQLREPFV